MGSTHEISAYEEKLGCATIDEDLLIRVADEMFYGMIDESICYPYNMQLLIDNRDFERFTEAVGETAVGRTNNTVVRINFPDGTKRWTYITIKNDGLNYKNGYLRNLSFHTIEKGMKYIGELCEKVQVYRSLLAVMNGIFLEYDVTKKTFAIYTLLNGQDGRIDIVSQKDFHPEQFEKWTMRECDRNTLQTFCNDLTYGRVNQQYQFKNFIFTAGEKEEEWLVKTKGVYEGNLLIKIVGTIQVLDTPGKQPFGLKEQFNQDPLTGLLNKKAITLLARENLKNGADFPLTFVIVDIDNFKSMNDTYGHMFGDDVIIRVVSIMKRVVKEQGVIGRIGGDEFFILLFQITEEQKLRNILKAIRQGVEWAYQGILNNLHISCSMGISRFPIDGTSYEELFKKADFSLYLAKERGRNRYVIYDEKKHGKIQNCDISDHMIELKAGRREEEKGMLYIELLKQLFYDGKGAINQVLGCIGELLNLEKINVYYGEAMECKMHWGIRYEDDRFASYIHDMAFLEQFNEPGCLILNKINNMSAKKAYEQMRKQNLSSGIKVLIGNKTEPRGLVSFDRRVIKNQWSDVDVQYLLIIGKMIGTILDKESGIEQEKVLLHNS